MTEAVDLASYRDMFWFGDHLSKACKCRNRLLCGLNFEATAAPPRVLTRAGGSVELHFLLLLLSLKFDWIALKVLIEHLQLSVAAK